MRKSKRSIEVLRNYARSEAMDIAEDIAAGEDVDVHLRVLEATLYFRHNIDEHERIDDVRKAIESAVAARGIKVQ